MTWVTIAPFVVSTAVQAQSIEPIRSADVVIGPTGADNAVLILISNPITAETPSCEVLVMADWQPDLRQFAAAIFDVYADSDSGNFSEPERYLKGPGTRDGTVAPNGDSVTEIISGQLCWPLECFPEVCPNPQRVWRTTWSTSDFTPRTVHVSTVTARFDVYFDANCSAFSFAPEEASADITIGCVADCDGNAVLALFDFLCFTNQFNSGSPDADCDSSGALDIFDFLCFTNAFNATC